MLKINKKFQIRADDQYNYGLYEYRLVSGPKAKHERYEWKHVGYFGKISHALTAAIDKYIKIMITQEDYDCKALLDKLSDIEKDLSAVDIIMGVKSKSKNEDRSFQQKEKLGSEEDCDVL